MGKRASRKWQKVSRCSRNEKQKTLLAFCEMYVIVSLLISERNKLILQSNHTIQLGTGTQGKRGNSVNRHWGKEKEGKAETVSCWDVGDWCQDDSSLLFVLLPSLNALLEVVDGGQHVLRERLAVERIGRRVEQVAQDDGTVHDLAAWQ